MSYYVKLTALSIKTISRPLPSTYYSFADISSLVKDEIFNFLI